MSSIESRVRSLERARAVEDQRWVERYNRAAQAVHRGTATMDQYHLVFELRVSGWRDECAQLAVFCVALARMGSGTDATWRLAIAYPPDALLPKPICGAIRRLQVAATSTATTGKQLGRLPFVTPGEFAEERFNAAVGMLALGDLHGIALRKHVWRLEGTRWVLSEAARDFGERRCFSTAEEADRIMCAGNLVTEAFRSGQLSELPSGGISHAELNRAVDRLNWTARNTWTPPWSDQVRSGQHADEPPCGDLQTGMHRIGCPEP